MQSRVKQAILHVHVQEHDQPIAVIGNSTKPNDDVIAGVTVQVTRVWRPPNGGSWGSANAATATSGLTWAQRRNGATLRVDVTEAIESWFRLPRSGLGLVVKAHDASKKRYQIPVMLDSKDHPPYLELYVDDEHRRRTKRTIGLTCTEESEETRCCRYPLTVDFEDFGWDWIIAPKKYEANFCMGDCPYAFLQKFPNTHVVHLASPPGYPGPCCTPRKMSAIRLLHFDHDLNIIVGDIPGMIVERCGCS